MQASHESTVSPERLTARIAATSENANDRAGPNKGRLECTRIRFFAISKVTSVAESLIAQKPATTRHKMTGSMKLNQLTRDAEELMVWNIPTQRPATPPAIIRARRIGLTS